MDPVNILDAQMLKAIRVGNIRVIFQIRKEIGEIFVYDINFRGNIYD
ncbi:MAG: hypothetical protein OHK0047_08450 [Leptolyngbyaceae cyanobacterium]|jgi:mRNA-degrading endonuclease RelE of RelBE toxin-antitoxin system